MQVDWVVAAGRGDSGRMCCSRALLRVPARGVDFTVGLVFRGLGVGWRLFFLAGAHLDGGAIGMKREA